MLSGSKAPSQPRRALREHNAALPDRHLPPHARAPAAQICTQCPHAIADRRKPRANQAPWRCATVVDVAVPLRDTMVLDEKELAMQRYLGLLAVGV